MNTRSAMRLAMTCWTLLSCFAVAAATQLLEPLGPGPYSVSSTNMEVAPEHAGIGDDLMHEVLLGRAGDMRPTRFITEILRYPDSAWITDVPLPDEPALYGPSSGTSLPIGMFLVYPSRGSGEPNPYSFPYHDARYGSFEDMLGPGEAPEFADPDARYPLIILAHGSGAHGIYDVGHAHRLASHGYIVAVLFYGDDRAAGGDRSDGSDDHAGYLRPLLSRAALDRILDSESFGTHVDIDNIGISGHSFGGFTALAVAGGRYREHAQSVTDERFTAAVIAAPWVGHDTPEGSFHAFGDQNRDLDRVEVPVLCFYGTRDEATKAAYIVPAAQQLSGPTYVVELVDQPHIFEEGSWEDRDAWELLFFAAYLKQDASALVKLRTGRSMNGGNDDIQHFGYQRASGSP